MELREGKKHTVIRHTSYGTSPTEDAKTKIIVYAVHNGTEPTVTAVSFEMRLLG